MKEKINRPELLDHITNLLNDEIPQTIPNLVEKWNKEYPLSRISKPTMRKYLDLLVDDPETNVAREDKFGRHGYYLLNK